MKNQKNDILIYPMNMRDTNLIAVYSFSRMYHTFFAEFADLVANMMIQLFVRLHIVTHTK